MTHIRGQQVKRAFLLRESAGLSVAYRAESGVWHDSHLCILATCLVAGLFELAIFCCPAFHTVSIGADTTISRIPGHGDAMLDAVWM